MQKWAMLMNVTRKLVVQKKGDKTEVLVIENGKAVEYLTDHANGAQAGYIYKGRINHVLSKFGASFIDIGLEKLAYMEDKALHAISQDGDQKGSGFGHALKPGDSLIVQVEREADDLKGAKVTTNIQLAGRFLVYLPYGGEHKISHRIEDERERMRLERLAHAWLKGQEGIIFRTLAAKGSDRDLWTELEQLREKWQKIFTKAHQVKPPCLLDRDGTLLERVSRDFFGPELKECVVNDPETYHTMEKMKHHSPELSFNLTLVDRSNQSLFARLGLSGEIEQLYDRKVKLKSGGYLVIDETEALTVIDVNSGSFTAREGQEQAAFITNLEAAREAARQIRLRDIGGIILIDFIDLHLEPMKENVLATLAKALKADRRETHLLGFTALGLVELTRKKRSASLWHSTTTPCPLCHGQGRIRS
jgi:ribonuclease G